MAHKTGRNDPCHCGSGKKYKRCCLTREESERLDARRNQALLAAEGDLDAVFDEAEFDVDDDDLLPEDFPPFDFGAIERIRYERGFVEGVDRIETGEGLRATEWTAPDIPQDLLDSLAREDIDELDGPWGAPTGACPIEVDLIHLQTASDDVVIEICHRAALRLGVESEEAVRLHRACDALEAAADRGVDVPAGIDAGAGVAAAAGEPAFALDGALEAHRRQKGTCELCGAEITSAGAGRHVAACAPRYDAASGPHRELIHVRVTAPGITGYWLDVEVRADTKLSALDDFLRGIWLECCGHLSCFEIGGVVYASQPYDDPLGGMFGRSRQRGLNAPMGKAMAGAGDHFTYEYDYGSTTRLRLVVRGTRRASVGREAVRLLARNQPLQRPCGICGAPAASVCMDCLHESANPFVCAAHAREHPCADGSGLKPVVNSPRMGVCGYG